MTDQDLPPQERFATLATWKRQATALLPLLVVMFLVTWLIFAAIFNALGLPVVGLLSALASAAFCALMMWNRKLDFAKTHAKAVLIATAEGLEVVEVHRRIHLRWSDMTSIGAAPGASGYQAPGKRGRQVKAASQLSQLVTVSAVYGNATTEYLPGIPPLQQKTFEQQAQTQPPHIVVGLYDSFDFPQNRLGEWFRVHRPDLLT